jgi:hypothetical protein
MALAKNILVVVDVDGVERDITYKRGPRPMRSTMPKPGTKTLERARKRLDHLCDLTQSAITAYSHWTPQLAEQLTAALVALEAGHDRLCELPKDYTPPRRPLVRAYSKLQPGQHCRLSDKATKYYMQTLKGKLLTLATVLEDGFVEVTLEGHESPRPFQVQLKHLVPAK